MPAKPSTIALLIFDSLICHVDPTRRDDIYKIIRTREPGVNGPFWLVQGFTGAFVRYPIFVPDVSATETFGFRYKDNSSAIAYSQLPSSVRDCSICYNATTREKWWVHGGVDCCKSAMNSTCWPIVVSA